MNKGNKPYYTHKGLMTPKLTNKNTLKGGSM